MHTSPDSPPSPLAAPPLSSDLLPCPFNEKIVSGGDHGFRFRGYGLKVEGLVLNTGLGLNLRDKG